VIVSSVQCPNCGGWLGDQAALRRHLDKCLDRQHGQRKN